MSHMSHDKQWPSGHMANRGPQVTCGPQRVSCCPPKTITLECRIDVGKGGDPIHSVQSFPSVFLRSSLASRIGSGRPLYPRVTSGSYME
ncbi:hypothetical protein TNCV_1043691 [Trichonephila clavipes]|nr:hypothetical protein TNCV_1043691 [Trichonephila clavipes]